MGDPRPHGDADAPSTSESRTSGRGKYRTPRWVKVSAILIALLVVAAAVLVVTGVHDPASFGH